MIKELIRCMVCNQVIPNYGGFELARANSLPGVEWNNADLARVKEFLTAHRGHPMEKLFIKADSGISEKPSYEPSRVTYFLADSSERKFLLRRTKTALETRTGIPPMFCRFSSSGASRSSPLWRRSPAWTSRTGRKQERL